MAFDAGELVATIRASGMQAFTSAMAGAKGQFDQVGRAATEQGAKVDAAARKSTQAATATGDAAKRAGAQQVAAGREATAATDTTTAAQRRQKTATTDTGTAAVAAGARKTAAEREAAAAARTSEAAYARQKDALKTVGTEMAAVGVVGVAAFVAAGRANAEFQGRLAQVRSLSHANQADMSALGQAALTMGAQYGLSANDVADAEIEEVKAGITVKQELGGALQAALTLAAAGQMNVADATEIATVAMTQFHVPASKAGHIADLLAAGADKALGSVGDLGFALKSGGLVAAQFGLSMDDTVGTLSAFANAGLIGENAGTALRQMLLQLAAPSKQARDLMDKLGISAYNAQGKFVGIRDLAGQLHDRLSTLKQSERDSAEAIIFGSHSIAAANVLYQEGADGIDGWIRGVNLAAFATQQAAGKQNSLAGDAKKVAAAFQNDLIRAGESLDPVLRGITQATSGVLNVIGAVPAPVLATGLAFTAVTGAVALTGGALLLLVPRVLTTAAAVKELRGAAATAATKEIPVLSSSLRAGGSAMKELKSTASATASVLTGPLGYGLAIGSLALAAWQAAVDQARASTSTLEAAASRGAAGVGKLVEAAQQGNDLNNGRGVFAWYEGIDQTEVTSKALDGLTAKLQQIKANADNPFVGFLAGNAALGATDETLGRIGTTLASVAQTNAPAAAQAFEQIAKKTDGSTSSLRTLLTEMPAYSQQLETTATAAGLLTGKETDAQKAQILLALASREAKVAGDGASSSAVKQAAAIASIQGNAAAASQNVQALATALRGLGSSTLDARAANRQLEQAVLDATAAIQKNGHSLNIHTQAGLNNQAALDAIATAATGATAATYAQTHSTEEARAKMVAARAEFVAVATKIYGSKKAADDLADSLHLIPSEVTAIIDVKKSAADAALEEIKTRINGVPRYLTITPQVGAMPAIAQGSGTVLKRAQGGEMPMVGPKGRDSFLIAAGAGEHMWSAADVDAVGGQGAVYRIRAAARAGSLAGYAAGGAIGDADHDRRSAAAEAIRKQHELDREWARMRAAQRAQARADKAVTAASDRAAAISGKGTTAAKHAAEMDARDARKKAADARKEAADAQKSVDQLKKDRDAAKQRADQEATRKATLQQGNEDFGIALSRGQYVDASTPFAATDQALTASRDANYTPAERRTLGQLASRSNQSIVGLVKQEDATKAALDAHTKALADNQTHLQDAQSDLSTVTGTLTSLKDAAASLAGQVATTVRGFFTLSNTLTAEQTQQTSLAHNAGTAAQWDEKVTTVTPGGTTVAAIRSSVTGSASSMQQFADQLDGLRQMGYSTDVVTDVANLGVEQGGQVAAALLSATQGDVQAINGGYTSMSDAGARAGGTVAGMTYGGQIDAATQQVQVAQHGVDLAQQQVNLAQAAIDADNANEARLEAAIVAQQQAVVKALQAALTGAPTKKMADGGVREAQVAPAGANILWAETETGGESYIPHSPSKRARSAAILAQTAALFGMQLTPLSRMADGGFLGSTGNTTTTTVGGQTNHFHGPWFGTPEQVMAAADRRAAAKKARAYAAAGLGRVNP